MRTDRELAQILWNYNLRRQDIKPADFIFVMCSYNLDVADRACDLFQNNMGRFIVVSGGIAHQDDLLNTGWSEAEAVVFSNRLLDLGMSSDNIIVEDKATNCGENIQFTKRLLASQNIKSGLIVQKPYMERRAYAAAAKQWSDISWQVTSPAIGYEGYIQKFSEHNLINIMVGDTFRLKNYAEKGFQIPQEIPEEVENSLKELINRGYNKHV